jgi:hypothetical protein
MGADRTRDRGTVRAARARAALAAPSPDAGRAAVARHRGDGIAVRRADRLRMGDEQLRSQF